MSSSDPLSNKATNGLIDRRAFLNQSLKLIGGMGLVGVAYDTPATIPAEPWRLVPGAPFSNYGSPSEFESGLVRWISATPGIPQNGVSWTPLHELDGTITPSGLHYERHHNGVPVIDPSVHTLVIHGLVDTPLEFSREALLRYPKVTRTLFIECGGNSNAGWNPQPVQTPAGYQHGLVSCSEWTGISLRLLLNETQVAPDARWIVAEGADAFSMTISLPITKVLDDCFIALFQNGEPLRPEQGYPMRLIVPGWEGVTHVKWIRTIQVTDRPVMARNETSRYTELQADGRARMFTFVMDAKSVITSPTAGLTLKEYGIYELSGLAWSGYGTISQVQVSADGGVTWLEAELTTPVLPQAFTRFRIPWQWTGQTAVLQSRATDTVGNVQPARAALVAARGRHGYFHYNAIVSWGVDQSGVVSHVYPDSVDPPAPTSTDPFEAPWS